MDLHLSLLNTSLVQAIYGDFGYFWTDEVF